MIFALSPALILFFGLPLRFLHPKSEYPREEKNRASEQSEGFAGPPRRDQFSEFASNRLSPWQEKNTFRRISNSRALKTPEFANKKQSRKLFGSYATLEVHAVHSKAPNSWINSWKGSSTQVREARFHKRESITRHCGVKASCLGDVWLISSGLIFSTHVGEIAHTICWKIFICWWP